MILYPETSTGRFSEPLSGPHSDFFKITIFAVNGIQVWIFKMFLTCFFQL